MSVVLEAERVTKRYGKTTALDGFSARFEENRVYGLLGRNGAGKTTLLNILTARAFATEGRALAFGQPVMENARVLPKLCYMPEKTLFDRHMKVRSILKVAASFYDDFDMEFAAALCKRFELDPKKTYRSLSRGYESILRIVIGLASRAPVTIFDEPVLGLDAAVREEFYQVLIDDFARRPRTYLLSTHMVEESANLFNEAVIVRAGRLVEQTPVERLRARAHEISGRRDRVEKALETLARRPQPPRTLHRETLAGSESAVLYGALPDAARRELAAAELELSPVPIQKLFIYLTQNAGSDGVKEG